MLLKLLSCKYCLWCNTVNGKCGIYMTVLYCYSTTTSFFYISVIHFTLEKIMYLMHALLTLKALLSLALWLNLNFLHEIWKQSCTWLLSFSLGLCKIICTASSSMLTSTPIHICYFFLSKLHMAHLFVGLSL